jgi:hypothetical protein
MKQRGFIALVFIIGCATGGVSSQLASSQLIVPPARAGTNPTRWEYLCASNSMLLSSDMTRSGSEGWELVSAVPVHEEHESPAGSRADGFVYCFKRPLP